MNTGTGNARETLPLDLSVVIPFFNEAESIEDVCREVGHVLPLSFASWEVVMVDDGSTDRTGSLMDGIADGDPRFRAIHLRPNSGQSAALEAGIMAARGALVGTLDGDGQNDPADLARVAAALAERGVDMMCGIRARRADSAARRIMSRIANRIRSRVLGDNIADVGCSLRVFRRECAQRVRFYRNAHRFFPALFLMQGYRVAEMPVSHRPRKKGVSKYGGGFRSRAFVGIVDLAGAWWLRRRALRYEATEHRSSA